MAEAATLATPGESKVAQIFPAMVAVATDLVKVGIAKDRKNDQQGFKFRGIDDVMNAVSPILARHDVLLLMHYEDYPDVERVTGKGGTLIFTKVKGTFTFVSAKDGSSVSVTTFGVAMDSGDKAMNKAMSAALKYCLLQIFLIPTEAGEDADQTTPEPSVPVPPAGFAEWWTDLKACSDEGFDPLRRMWIKSVEPYRDYAMTFRKDDWIAMKGHANKITEAQKAAEAAAADAAPSAS